jgi:Ca-activated chloride channel family protein
VAGFCPLEGTKVDAEIAGFGVRVNVVQTFKNPTNEPIEAVYTFPLSDSAAVDRMRMQVGDRVVEGIIKRRDEARQIYEAAKAQGQAAGLLDQERPNIFTQSVANIMPGATVRIQISYAELMRYEDGQFEFSFPMTVAPRYFGRTPDASKVSPPITPEGTTAGANIDLNVDVDAGAPIYGLMSVLHKINVREISASHESVQLADEAEVPNRDFILKYRTAGAGVESAFITQSDPDGKGGFFTLVTTPPETPAADQIVPREVIFVLDTSGSQQGFPLAKGKELDHKLIDTLRPDDTFNVLKFNMQVTPLWSEPRHKTGDNVAEANQFIDAMVAGGGTDIHGGLLAALDPPADPRRVRLVVIETDGLIGNENEVLDAIQKHEGKGARVFTFGVGNSVNRFIINAMSAVGKGDSEMVTLADKADAAVERFVKRTQTPILTNLSAAFDGVAVLDVLPKEIPDVFDNKPVVLYGRYKGAGRGTVTLSGQLGDSYWSKQINLDFTQNSEAGALPSLWARQKIDDLSSENYLAAYQPDAPTRRSDLQDKIVDVSLKYGVMSEFTSFVAVEPTVINIDGRQRTVHVPVEMGDGMSYEMGGGLVQGIAVTGQIVGARGGGGGGGGFGGGGFGQAPGSTTLNSYGGGTSGATSLNRFKSTGATPMPTHAQNRDVFGLPTPEAKIDKALKNAKGKVEIQIWLTTFTDAVLKAVENAGMHIDAKNGRLRILFGTCDGLALKGIAKLKEVERIEPLGD